jgi:TolB protein
VRLLHLVLAGATLASLIAVPAPAQRKTVLDQIQVPHNYYYREMYLPRVTTGPNAADFSPDGRVLVYSMGGSLWKQWIESTIAQQLTAGPGYDFQPDWSPDGKRIAFVRYNASAMEIMQLDVASGAVTPLTKSGAVNVEPRWSPDGSRLAWVSTAGTGRFHIFVGTADGNGLQGKMAWPERRSRTARYYYGPFDHELSPTWSPDGKELIYVGNPEIVNGSGNLWRRALTGGAEPILIRQEETNWRATPDWSPEGKRVIYSSYLGQPWHQLWITTAAGGGDPIPLTYGESDVTMARWSPDGSRLVFVSNRNGNTELWLRDVVGGAQYKVEADERRYLKSMGRLELRVVDASGKPVAARVAVLGADDRAYAPDDAWIHADDGFDRSKSRFETHYFHVNGAAELAVPAGSISVTVSRGLESQIEKRTVPSGAGRSTPLTIQLRPLALPADWRAKWLSGDVHLHMNYGGLYRNTPAGLVKQADAEDLDVAFNLIVNKEQRIPDIGYFSTAPDKASTPSVLLSHGQEVHTSYWGHMGLLGLRDHFLLPDYVGYANTAFASLVPTNATIADLAHAQGALVGYVHPFDTFPDPAKDASLTNALPIDVALGKVDYYEVVGFADHRASADVWHRLLNCGFRLSAAAGTDAMTNFASLRGPVGLNRVYVQTDGAAADDETRLNTWLAGLKAGRTMATNGPLLGFTVEDRGPGEDIALAASGGTLRFKGFLRSSVPVDRVEIVMNGKVVRTVRPSGERRAADLEGSLPAKGQGWVLLRAWNDGADPEVFDVYPYATTNPVFFRSGDAAEPHCGADADYFIAWIERVQKAAASHPGYNTAAERDSTLSQISDALAIWRQRR